MLAARGAEGRLTLSNMEGFTNQTQFEDLILKVLLLTAEYRLSWDTNFFFSPYGPIANFIQAKLLMITCF